MQDIASAIATLIDARQCNFNIQLHYACSDGIAPASLHGLGPMAYMAVTVACLVTPVDVWKARSGRSCREGTAPATV